MTKPAHVSFLLFLTYIIICAHTKYLTGKAFYCRDPDTGKLHAVNSTWPSTTFCGNYTCKLKKRAYNVTEYRLLRQINITNDNISRVSEPIDADETTFVPITKSANVLDMNESPSITIEKRVKPEAQGLMHRENENNKPQTQKAVNVNDGDRYLTESEIKSITEILHTVKKSDLDAIVDIYNLAQEIYQEMDKTTEKIVDNNGIGVKDNRITLDTKDTSYWYEPLHLGHKYKPNDSEKQGSGVISAKETFGKPTFFEKAAPSDLNKIPQYYPFSEFQRMASYVHPKNSIENLRKPCSESREVPKLVEKPKVVQPSILLPYPFAYIPHYNYTYPGNLFQNGHPLSWNMYSRKPYQPYIGAYIARVPPNAVFENAYPNIKDEDVISKEYGGTKILDKIKGDPKLQEWQTRPLPLHVLEDIKANIEKKLKPSPLTKMLNIEKVGKVIKLDEFIRSKRNVGDNGDEDLGGDDEASEYDVYLERTTCRTEADTRPGYFRVGNMNEVYPGCCPQRID